MTKPQGIKEMTVSGIHHLVERAGREGHEQQHLRELLINSIEAGATRVEFGPEWNAVETEGVYRLMVADDGRGMSPDELQRFLTTFGGGGKPIGAEHENFGVGAKTSLLPWNHAGVVVLSWTQENPDGALIWLCRDPDTGEYGAKVLQDEDGSFDITVRPFGVWKKVRPAWLKTGTVTVCLGNTGREDTFLGKDGKGDVKGIAAYLNKRIWTIPDGVAEVVVQELRSTKRSDWPRSYAEASAPGAGPDGVDRRWNRRLVRGAKHFVTDVKHQRGRLRAQGTVRLHDHTELDWYLWEGERPGVHSYAQETGYTAALYKNELYDLNTHGARFRAFGITAASVRSNLTIVARPPAYKDGVGVYPDTARNALKLNGEALPWEVWAEEFARNLPDEVSAALAVAGPTKTGSLQGGGWQQRLVDRFGSLWQTIRYVQASGARLRMVPDQGPGHASRNEQGPHEAVAEPGGREAPVLSGEKRPGHLGEQQGPPVLASEASGSGVGARPLRTKGGLPAYEWTTMENTDEDGVYPIAWYRDTKDHPNGVVQIARDFRMFVELRRYWREQYPDHLGEQVDEIVEEVYGEAMVARIAHSEQLVHDPRWGKHRVEEELRSQPALTAALLGLVSEDAVIAARMGRLGVRRRAVGA